MPDQSTSAALEAVRTAEAYADAHTTHGIRTLLAFYSPPNVINGKYDNDYAAGVLSRYDDVVLGSGLEDPGNSYYGSTKAILAKLRVLSSSTAVWGYIDTGVTTGNLSLDTIKTQVDQWLALGATGIFLDTFGYDYHTSRSRQSSILNYVHSVGVGAIMNAWNSDDVLGSAVDTTYNPSGAPTVAGSADVILLESWITNSVSYTSPYYATISDLKTRADKVRAYRSSLGVKIYALNQYLNTGTDAAVLKAHVDISEALARVFRLDSSGTSAASYSSSGADTGVVTPQRSSFWSTPFRPTAPYLLNGDWTVITASDLGLVIDYSNPSGTYDWTQA